MSGSLENFSGGSVGRRSLQVVQAFVAGDVGFGFGAAAARTNVAVRARAARAKVT
jgi:hypothetical protein